MINPFSRKTDLQVRYTLSDRFDLALFVTVLLLLLMGFLAIYSSTQNTVIEKGNFVKQLLAVGLSITVLFVIYFLPANLISSSSLPLYIFSILLLIAVLIFGRKVGGAKAWLYFGSFSFQPAELAKLATVLYISKYLSVSNRQIDSVKEILMTLSLGFLPVILIMLEPDLGSSLVFIVMIISLIFWKGISLFGLFLVLSPGIVMGASLFGLVYFIIAIVGVIVCLYFFRRDLFLSAAVLSVNVAAGFFVEFTYS